MVRLNRAQAAARAVPKEEHGRDRNHAGERQRADQRQSPAPPERRGNRRLRGLRKVGVAANGRKRGLQSVGSRLVEPYGAVKVLETLLAEIPQEDMQVLLLVIEQGLGRLRHQNLPTVPSSADTRGAMNGQPRVAPIAGDGLPRVQTHPHLDLDALGPRVRPQGKLALYGGEERVPRAGKSDEERVSLCIDLVAAVGAEGGSKEALVIGQHNAISIAKLLDESGRPLDVGEEKRHRASRYLCHAARSVTPRSPQWKRPR